MRWLWRRLRRPDQLWAEMDEEMRFHVDMEAERLQRERGLDPGEARRQAAIAFGGVEKYKEAGRDALGLAWLGGLTLDLKLGSRMLVKYPGLTIVGGLAMVFAIWVGAIVFEMVMLFVSPTLPLPDGDRIFHLRNWDVQASDPEPRVLHDFVVWRQAMRSVTAFGAWEDVTRNLAGRDGEIRPVQVAAITHRDSISPRRCRCWTAPWCLRTSGPERRRWWSSATTCGGLATNVCSVPLATPACGTPRRRGGMTDRRARGHGCNVSSAA